MRIPTLPFLLIVLALGACTRNLTGQHLYTPRFELSQVKLSPEAARRAINRYRAKRGLSPLTLEKRLTRAAVKHARDLAGRDRISHTGSDGSDPWTRVRDSGYKPQLAAENVGAGQGSFAEVLKGWKDSPGHNKNLLLPDATHMGIALVKNPNSRSRTFWTLVLGKPSRP